MVSALFDQLMVCMFFLTAQINFAAGRKRQGGAWLFLFLLCVFVLLSNKGGI